MRNENNAAEIIIEWHEGGTVDDGTGTRPGEGGATCIAACVSQRDTVTPGGRL